MITVVVSGLCRDSLYNKRRFCGVAPKFNIMGMEVRVTARKQFLAKSSRSFTVWLKQWKQSLCLNPHYLVMLSMNISVHVVIEV